MKGSVGSKTLPFCFVPHNSDNQWVAVLKSPNLVHIHVLPLKVNGTHISRKLHSGKRIRNFSLGVGKERLEGIPQKCDVSLQG